MGGQIQHKHARSVVHDKEISFVRVLSHKNLLVTVGLDQYLKIWRTKDAELQGDADILVKHKIGKDVSCIKYCPKNGVLALSCTDGSVLTIPLKVAEMIAFKENQDSDLELDE